MKVAEQLPLHHFMTCQLDMPKHLITKPHLKLIYPILELKIGRQITIPT